jgi:hypothetical protein
MKATFRLAILTLSLLLTLSACTEKAPDLTALTPELEELGITVKENTAILSNDSPEAQSSQWKYLTEHMNKTEHISVQVTGQVLSHSVFAKQTDDTYLYICPPSADLDAEELYALPVALPKELLRAYVDEYGDPSGVGLFPMALCSVLRLLLKCTRNFNADPRGTPPFWSLLN